jgi:hypothetical protein
VANPAFDLFLFLVNLLYRFSQTAIAWRSVQ